MKKMMKEIYLIRHGETEHNKLGIPQGSEVNPSLNETGVSQATITGKYLKKYNHIISKANRHIIFTSPMLRAKETATIISAELEIKAVIEDDNLIERSSGLVNPANKDKFKKSKYYKEYKEIEEEYNHIIDPIEKKLFFKTSRFKKNIKNLNGDTIDDINKLCDKIIK